MGKVQMCLIQWEKFKCSQNTFSMTGSFLIFCIVALDFSKSRLERLDQAFETLRQHEENLSERFLNGIKPYLDEKQIRLLGSRDFKNRTPTFALASHKDSLNSLDLVQTLNQNGILCTHGNHYAPELVEDCLNETEGR